VVVKPGSSAELPCALPSNLAHMSWRANGSAITEASRFHFIGDNGLLIYSVGPEDQGSYECWSLEWAPAVGKNFSRLVTGYTLVLAAPPRGPRKDPARTPHLGRSPELGRREPPSVRFPEGNANTPGPSPLTAHLTTPPTPQPRTDSPLTPPPSRSSSSSSSSTLRLRPSHRHLRPSSEAPGGPETLDPSAQYLQRGNVAVLLCLFLLFFLLFLAAVAYNCYMRYLPAPCLRLRAALVGGHKSSVRPEYRACEAGLVEPPPVTDKLGSALPTRCGSGTNGNQSEATLSI